MSPSNGSRKLAAAVFETVLWLVGGLCLLYVCLAGARGWAAQQQAATISPAAVEAQAPPPTAGVVMARLEIPALAMTVPVLAGCDAATLDRGTCHMDRTAMPGGLGNMVIAGHRDRTMRPLERIHPHDAVRVTSGEGTFTYQVDRTEIVAPSAVEVLEIHDRPELTLITCYPFHYVGSAPSRFVVHAHLLSAGPAGR